MSKASPEPHVKELFSQLTLSERQSRTITNLISHIKSDFSESAFINELLQNADDALSIHSERSTVSFCLTDHYLIVSYDGRKFDYDDVETLCDAASLESKKRKSINSIGHKGIGFKAVFHISDNVLIRSGEYSFRFSKQHPGTPWEKKPAAYPWQIIPIWTTNDDIKKESELQELKNSSVTIAMKFKNSDMRELLVKDFKELRNQPSHLLFLKNIDTLSFEDKRNPVNSFKLRLEHKQDPKNLAIKRVAAYVDEKNLEAKQPSASWYVCTTHIKIREDIYLALQREEYLPDKYKEITTTDISIAIQYRENQLVRPTSLPFIFCYLSTKVPLQLPFLINAEFFLKQSREEFNSRAVDIAWNGFLFEKILYHQFEILEFIAEQDGLQWKQVLNMLTIPDPAKLNLDVFKFDSQRTSTSPISKFQSQFSAGGKHFRLVRNFYHKELFPIPDLHIDSYQFIKTFSEDKIDRSVVRNCVSPDIEKEKLGEIQQIIDKNKNEFNVRRIMFEISKDNFSQEFKSVEFFEKFIRYLGDYFRWNTDGIYDKLRYLRIVLTENGSLVYPDSSKIFFPNPLVSDYVDDFKDILVFGALYQNQLIRGFLQNQFRINCLNFESILRHVNTEKNIDKLIRFTKLLMVQYRKNSASIYWMTMLPDATELSTKYKNAYIFTKNNPQKLLYIDSQGTINSLNLDFTALNEIKMMSLDELKPLQSQQIPSATIEKFRKIINSNEGHAELEYHKLSILLLKIKNLRSLLPAGECYLSDQLDPLIQIEPYLPYASANFFVGEEYLDSKLGITKELCKNFFLAIRVQQDFSELKMLEKILTESVKKKDTLVALTGIVAQNVKLKSPVIEVLKKIEIKLTTQTFSKNNNFDLYFSEDYKPASILDEKEYRHLKFISAEYLIWGDVTLWKKFFNAFGVRKKIDIMVLKDRSRDKIPERYRVLWDGYLQYLKDIGQLPTADYTINSRGKFTVFFGIDYFSHIKNTVLFWEIIKNHWNMIYPAKKVDFAREYGAAVKNIISSLVYCMNLAVRDLSGKPGMSQCYLPSIMTEFSGDLDEKYQQQPWSILSEQKLTQLGFANKLSFDHCLRLLNKFSEEKTCSPELFVKIGKIYQYLIDGGTELPDQELKYEKFLLPNELNQFTESKKLFYFELKPFKNADPNLQLLKKPAALGVKEFAMLAQKLGVNVFSKNKLEVKCEGNQLDETDSMRLKLRRKLPYLILLEAKQHDLQCSDFTQKFLIGIIEKIRSLLVYRCDRLALKYEDVIRQPVHVWFKLATLYYENRQTSESSVEGFFYWQGIAEFLKEYFSLKILVEDFWKLLLLEKESSIEEAFAGEFRDLSNAKALVQHEWPLDEKTTPLPPPLPSPPLTISPSGNSISGPPVIYQTLKDIGRKGERHIFDKLTEKYRLIYGDRLTVEFPELIIERANDTLKVVKWLNPGNTESGKHHDFEITIYQGQVEDEKRIIKRRYIEVKSSINREVTGYFSEKEWQEIQGSNGKSQDSKEPPYQYSVYFVANCNGTPQVTKNKDIDNILRHSRIEVETKYVYHNKSTSDYDFKQQAELRKAYWQSQGLLNQKQPPSKKRKHNELEQQGTNPNPT